ncbi:MHYT domain-containing protein [Streptomyces lacrimifluminis]|uniref:Membrane protein n=1 Tax=Streptomyces lacrimifluminis TaxID=1500077 RepID=A0A917L3F5_9ACTN|nr:MHYT domain-containing protein [Streptomyces lacrimifluminis]GGJ42891.1 membrane protein [Streptomyces lacrimifluminis]
MTATVSNFHYGAVTPVAAYLMACLGAALGLRCTTRSLRRSHRRAGWLALGAVSIGCGIWTMHFIAMIGFSVQGALVSYDLTKTLLSLAVAIAVVAVGVFLVGYRGGSPVNLGMAGTITGIGVAAMHYLGMAAIHTNGSLHYNGGTVALSVGIAVAAATAALWAAVSIHKLWASLGASLVMGVAVTGMHYTGMAAVSVHLTGQSAVSQSSTSLMSFLLAMLAGPLTVLLVAGAIVMFDPDMMLGDDEWDRPAYTRYGAGDDLPGHSGASRGNAALARSVTPRVPR